MNDPDPTDLTSTAFAVEGLIEEYLIARGNGESVDPSEYADRLRDPAERRRFLVVVRAEEYLFRVEEGEDVDLDEVLACLSDEAARAELRLYVERSREAGRFRPEPLAPGTLLAKHYRIERELSSGGTAIVYLAKDENLESDCTIKAFNYLKAPEQVASEWEELVLGEAQRLAQLESRNIVTVREVVRDGRNSYMVMALVRGPDLFRVLHALRGVEQPGRDGRNRVEAFRSLVGAPAEVGDHQDMVDPRSWPRTVARVVHCAIHALEKAHDSGVLHRDVKPNNILLVGGGEPVLIDFGFGSGAARSVLAEKRLVGTPAYMAPEQLRLQATGESPATDVYQTGLVLYEMLALRRAFQQRGDESYGAFLDRKMAGYYEPVRSIEPTVPRALEAVCDRALAPDPGERYESARSMRVDLERFLARKPPRHARLGAWHRALAWGAWGARQPAAVVAAVALLALTLLFATADRGWYPPAVSPYVLFAGDRAATPLTADQEIVWGGSLAELGVEVSASVPSYVYAFSLSGPRRDERFVRALRVHPLGEARPIPSAPGPVLVEEGETRLSCAFLKEAPSPIEGLLVFVCDEKKPYLDEWIREIEDARADFDRPVLYSDDDLARIVRSTPRGADASELTQEELDALYRNLASTDEVSDREWKLAGVKPYEFNFEIHREGDD